MRGPLADALPGQEPERERQKLTADAYVRRALVYASRPRPEDQGEAERLFRKALRLDESRADAHAGLAGISVYLYTLGLDETTDRLDGAHENARAAVNLAPGSAEARRALALVLAASDRLTPALEEARAAIRLAPESAPAHAVLSAILRLRGDHDEALEEARRAAELAPDSPRMLIALANALRELKRYSEALEMYGQAIDLDFEAIVPQLGAAATLHLAGNLGTAGRTYQLLGTRWDYALNRVLLGAAGVHLSNRSFERALETYRRISIPDDGSLPTLLALYGKGYCLLKLERNAEAEYFLSTLLDRVPPDYDGSQRGREFIFRAYDDLIDFFDARGKERRVESLLRFAAARRLAPTRMARRLAVMVNERGDRKEAGSLLANALMRSDPREDPLQLSETALMLARVATSNGGQRLPRGSPAAVALDLAAGRVGESRLGLVHYRLARALALTRNVEGTVESLERARRHGYLPIQILNEEADFDGIRQEAAFRAVLEP